MPPSDDMGFERELRLAMTEGVNHLAQPRIDIAAIRRRTATRRRVLVPLVVGLASMVVAGPLALAKSGVLAPKLAGDVVEHTTEASAPRLVGEVTQPQGQAGDPAGAGEEAGEGAGEPVPVTGCVTSSGPLPAAERAVLLRDATAAVGEAEAEADRALGKIQRLSLADGTVDRLVPAAGDTVRLVTCGDQVRLAPAERTAILAKARKVVTATALVAAGVVRETVGKSELAAITPVGVAAVSRTGTEVLLYLSLGGDGIPKLGTVVVTVRLTDVKVTRVDLSRLDLRRLHDGRPLQLPGAELLSRLDLLEGLRGLKDLGAAGDLVPNMSEVLDKDVKIVPPVVR